MSDFKIETKPTLWDVKLFHGAYSDYGEEHYYIRANDRQEAWHQFKRYWQDIFKDPGGYLETCLVLVDSIGKQEDTFIPEGWNKKYDWQISEEDEEPRLEYDYGDANGVRIENLAVIEFKR